jgi:hypothetical protein
MINRSRIRQMHQRITHANNQVGRFANVLLEIGQIIANGCDLQIAGTLRQLVKQFLTEINRDNPEAPFG